ncbi:MAG: aspartate aminotransferase family protein [Candidatus Sumerlaeota bacterium]|nr:aspartate aminotransferase family protein [Candidatus Sumerlaeota bacterium]
MPKQPLSNDLFARYVNPEFARLLAEFDYGRRFVHASGTRLRDDARRDYLDFLAGFGVHNIGHNHPALCEALTRAIASSSPSMLNIDAPEQQGVLAQRLNGLTHPDLCRVAFANSGAEAVDIAIKAARAATGRRALVACEGAFHGLSIGALSLLSDSSQRGLFGPLLQEVEWIPFGDTDKLEHACARLKPAAFFVEPIQGEGGIRQPAPSFLKDASDICRRHGSLFVVDEIQTGLGRTGAFFATPFQEAPPDALLLGKALSGGMVPISAAMMTADVWKRAFGAPERCHLNASTFAGSHLATTAALATLDILDREALPARAAAMGRLLGEKLKELAARHSIIQEIRGKGLLQGVVFERASGLMMKAVPAWAREGLFAQVICALLLRDHGVIAQPCGLAQNVLRAEPPLIVSEQEVLRFVAALDQVLAVCPSHSSALKSAFRKSILRGEL